MFEMFACSRSRNSPVFGLCGLLPHILCASFRMGARGVVAIVGHRNANHGWESRPKLTEMLVFALSRELDCNSESDGQCFCVFCCKINRDFEDVAVDLVRWVVRKDTFFCP